MTAFAWWYFAIAAGFVLLGLQRLVIGGTLLEAGWRWLVAAGFLALGWLTLRPGRK